MVDIHKLISAIEQRRCILFLGAGVHYPPPEKCTQYNYPTADRPPLGTQLSHCLVADSLHQLRQNDRLQPIGRADKPARVSRAHEMREHHDYVTRYRDELQRVSWFYEVKHDRNALVNCLRQQVETNRKPSAVVRALAELDFPIVITTNYDRLFERALEGCGIKADTIIYNKYKNVPTRDWVGEPARGVCRLLKIHGCVSEPRSIVITDEDYIHFVARMLDPDDYRPVPKSIRAKLVEWSTLFVGYSLLDYNLRLLFQTMRWHLDPSERPPTFSLDLHPDRLINEWYDQRQHLVTFVIQDIWNFVPMLYQAIRHAPMPP